METANEDGNDHAGAQSRGAEGGTNLSVGLGGNRDIVDRLRDSQPLGTSGGFLLNDAADEIERLRNAIQRALDDEESGTGWGPDVTVCGYLREALLPPNVKLTGSPASGESELNDGLAAVHCPNCPDRGWYGVSSGGMYWHEKCDFCRTVPKSVFNIARGG